MNAAKYSTSDYLPRPLAYWKVNGVQWALPFAVSAPILYYNQNAFTKAGLNPANPPTTLPQMLADAREAQGLRERDGPRPGPVAPRDLAGVGQPALREPEERAEPRGRRPACSTPTPPCPSSTSSTSSCGRVTRRPTRRAGPTPTTTCSGIGSGKYGMTIETSAALGTVTQLLAGGQYANVKLGIGRLPRLQLVGAGRDRAGRLGRLHLEQGVRAAPGGGMAVHLLPLQHAEPGDLGGRHRVYPGAQVRRPRRPPSNTCG